MFSHDELDLPIDWLPVIVVFEIQTLVATQSTHILEFLRSKVWIFRSYSLSWIFTKTGLLSSSFKMFSEISFIRQEFPASQKRMTPNTVPSTFLWHQFCNTDHRTFSFFFSLSLCLAIGLPMHAFFCLLFEEQNHHEKRAKQRFQTLWEHRTVQCYRVCFSRSQRFHRGLDRQWALCHCPQKWSCRTAWAHNLCLHLTWPGSQTSRCPALSGRESSARRWTGTWCRSECAGTAKTGETWEWREMTHMQQTPFSWPWAMRVCAHAWKCTNVIVHAKCTEKCACNKWVYVHWVLAGTFFGGALRMPFVICSSTGGVTTSLFFTLSCILFALTSSHLSSLASSERLICESTSLLPITFDVLRPSFLPISWPSLIRVFLFGWENLARSRSSKNSFLYRLRSTYSPERLERVTHTFSTASNTPSLLLGFSRLPISHFCNWHPHPTTCHWFPATPLLPRSSRHLRLFFALDVHQERFSVGGSTGKLHINSFSLPTTLLHTPPSHTKQNHKEPPQGQAQKTQGTDIYPYQDRARRIQSCCTWSWTESVQ